MLRRTEGYRPSQAACLFSVFLSLSSILYWFKAKWTVSPTLTLKSWALPGMMLEVTSCCGGGGGAAGGGAVLTASCLCVQAASSNAADNAANLNVLENFNMAIDLPR